MNSITEIAKKFFVMLAAALLPSAARWAATVHRQLLELVDRHAAHFSGISRTIWEYPELGDQEEKSSALL